MLNIPDLIYIALELKWMTTVMQMIMHRSGVPRITIKFPRMICTMLYDDSPWVKASHCETLWITVNYNELPWIAWTCHGIQLHHAFWHEKPEVQHGPWHGGTRNAIWIPTQENRIATWNLALETGSRHRSWHGKTCEFWLTINGFQQKFANHHELL